MYNLNKFSAEGAVWCSSTKTESCWVATVSCSVVVGGAAGCAEAAVAGGEE